jgi:hypothetical protein
VNVEIAHRETKVIDASPAAIGQLRVVEGDLVMVGSDLVEVGGTWEPRHKPQRSVVVTALGGLACEPWGFGEVAERVA